MAWCTWVRPALAFAKWLARWPPAVGWWGPRSDVCLEVDTPGRHKMPCCASPLRQPLPPLAFHLLYPSVCERGRERRKRKFESGEVCSIVRNLPRIPSGGRRIPGFRARADGPLCQPHWRSWMRFIASTMLSGSTCAHHLCMPRR
jgi:hypothetical protein